MLHRRREMQIFTYEHVKLRGYPENPRIHKERGCATVAVVIAIASAAVLFGCVAYGGYKGLELNKTVTRNDAVLTEVKSYMSHLSAQLQQLQRVDTSLGARLLAVESALRGAAPGATGADEGNKKRGKGVSGKGKGKAKP